MSAMLRRPITSGSRQAPDPYDQYLESRCLYRKHTARDASCLFRVIAEQMYDTQKLHYEVRLECVRFMTRKRRIFEKDVRGDFDAYLRDMMKPRTYGTMLELRAVCCMYRRNAILFEPFNMGSVVTYSSKYRQHFKVFYTNEYHFDSVYTVNYIKDAAICQSICFKLLYKMLFKLPDVKYAVEAMLHPHTFDWGSCEVTTDSRGYIEHVFCRDGRIFKLNMPENTSCILENYKLCNFHNSRFVDKNDSKALEILYMCPDRLNSCVRQLLEDGITPFPYKVAKSLDTYMYRNIEFDSWNDLRKESKRFNIYVNDYNFKVGAKCLVELPCDDTQMYTCHIQKIYRRKSHCLVFIEQIGNKFVVPYMSLHPLPPDEFKPWTVPLRCRRQMNRMHLGKHITKPKTSKWRKNKLYDVKYFDANKCDAIDYLDNYYGCHPVFHNEMPLQHHPNEIIEQAEQQPTTSLQRQQQQQLQQLPKKSPEAGTTVAAPVLQQQQQVAAAAVPPAPFINYMTPPSWMNSSLRMPEEYQQSSLYSGPAHSDGCMYMQYGGYAPPPPPPVSMQPPRLPLPPFARAPYMMAPPPSIELVHFSSNSSSNNVSKNNRNSSNSNNARTTAIRANEDQSESRRSLYSIGEDLPPTESADSVALQQHYYNKHPDAFKRILQVQLHDERMRHYANNNNNNMRKQHGIHNHHPNNNNTDQQKERNNGLATPPTTPTDIATTSTGIKLLGGATSMKPPGVEKERLPTTKSNNNLNKLRTKGRPEPLADLAAGKNQHLAQVSLLPTPSPSPNTQGNKFVFYTPPPPHSSYQPPPSSQMKTSAILAAIKAGQNPYAWSMPTMAPPPGAMNMYGIPCDMYNNYNPEQNGALNPQQPLQSSNYKPPRY